MMNYSLAFCSMNSGLIPGLCPANERQCYFVTTSLIGCAQGHMQPCEMNTMQYVLGKFQIQWVWRIQVFLSLQICNDEIDGLMQERGNSSALAMELCLSCINPLKCCYYCSDTAFQLARSIKKSGTKQAKPYSRCVFQILLKVLDNDLRKCESRPET